MFEFSRNIWTYLFFYYIINISDSMREPNDLFYNKDEEKERRTKKMVRTKTQFVILIDLCVLLCYRINIIGRPWSTSKHVWTMLVGNSTIITEAAIHIAILNEFCLLFLQVTPNRIFIILTCPCSAHDSLTSIRIVYSLYDQTLHQAHIRMQTLLNSYTIQLVNIPRYTYSELNVQSYTLKSWVLHRIDIHIICGCLWYLSTVFFMRRIHFDSAGAQYYWKYWLTIKFKIMCNYQIAR